MVYFEDDKLNDSLQITKQWVFYSHQPQVYFIVINSMYKCKLRRGTHAQDKKKKTAALTEGGSVADSWTAPLTSMRCFSSNNTGWRLKNENKHFQMFSV